MKRLLLILIFTFSFQTLTKADDIRDFEIEGISIGDSLLDNYSEEKINEQLSKENLASIGIMRFPTLTIASTVSPFLK